MNKKIRKITNIRVDYAMEDPSKPDETDWYEKKSYAISLEEYDIKGNLVKTVSYNRTGDIHEHYQYKYDDMNNMIEELNFIDEDEIAEHKYFDYDGAGRQIQERVLYMEGGENIFRSLYDDSGNLIKRIQTDADGETEETSTYEYVDGKLVQAIVFDGDHVEISRNQYTYNEEGKQISYAHIASDERSNYRTEYSYNEKGLREKTLKYNFRDQLIEKAIFTFDDRNNITEIIEEDIRDYKKIHFTYDENNKAVKQEEYNRNDDILLSVERSYDDEGKVLEAVVYLSDPVENIRNMYVSKYEYDYFDE